MHLKVSSAKWRPCCLGLNVLKILLFSVDLAANNLSMWFQCHQPFPLKDFFISFQSFYRCGSNLGCLPTTFHHYIRLPAARNRSVFIMVAGPVSIQRFCAFSVAVFILNQSLVFGDFKYHIPHPYREDIRHVLWMWYGFFTTLVEFHKWIFMILILKFTLIVLQYGLYWKLDDCSAELSSNFCVCVCVHKMGLLFLATDLMWNYFS